MAHNVIEAQSTRDHYQKLKSELKLDRESFDAHYKSLAEFIKPRRGRFDINDVNRGAPRHRSIINSHASQAYTTAQAGLFAGVMSPSRPWFDLGFPDPELKNSLAVKDWLDQVTKVLRNVFNAGNLYTMAPQMLGELLLFGTGCMSHVDDDENLARFYTHTVGSYWLMQNDKLEVDGFMREYKMTARQMALEFGLDNLSPPVRTAIDNGNLNSRFDVTQVIERNTDFRPNHLLSRFKLYVSVKYEAADPDRERFLSVKGFDEFPVYCPRWGVTGEDTYATDCPGMTTLGDVRSLQIEEKRKAQGIDKQVNPPLVGPATLANTPVSSIPGGLTLYSGDSTRNKLEALYQVNFSLADLKEDIQRVERRIDRGWYVDLFLAITNMEGIQPRNKLELSDRDAERLLQLGPVLERLHGDFLDHLISRTFNQADRAGLIPPPPPDIQGQPLKVEYISSLAQAQRAVDTQGIDKVAGFVSSLVGAGLSDGKKFDGDQAIKNYAELIGTPAKLIKDDEAVKAERDEEAQRARLAAGLEAGGALADMAGATGSIDLGGNNPVASAVEQVRKQQGG